MSVFKKLAGEAALYGLSSILARMVNFILVPIQTKVMTTGEYGVMGQLYGWLGLIMILYTFRLESAYFRYASHDQSSKSYSNGKILVLFFSIIGTILVLLFKVPIARALHIESQSYLVQYIGLIVVLDAICELPFAKLRLEKRPIKFVTIRVINILINVSLNIYFFILAPKFGFPTVGDKVAAVVISNLLASACTFLLLQKEYLAEGFKIDKIELKKIIHYSWPLLIVGLGSILDDAMTRQYIGWFAEGSVDEKKSLMGEYNACVKFAVLISLFVQAFRYAAEPFFFKHMHHVDAKKDYAQITTYFAQFLMIGFVAILLYIDFIKDIIVRNPAYFKAMSVVPIVLMANVIFGIYYNISNWYRLTDKTQYGMYATFIGVALTLLFNYLLVPRYGYIGTAWAMLICYIGMAIVTYHWGQKFYPVDYDLRKIFVAITSGVLIYLLSINLQGYFQWHGLKLFVMNSILFMAYLFLFNRPLFKMVLK